MTQIQVGVVGPGMGLRNHALWCFLTGVITAQTSCFLIEKCPHSSCSLYIYSWILWGSFPYRLFSLDSASNFPAFLQFSVKKKTVYERLSKKHFVFILFTNQCDHECHAKWCRCVVDYLLQALITCNTTTKCSSIHLH